MRALLVLLAFSSLACASSPGDPSPPLDPRAATPQVAAGCYRLHVTGKPAPDVSLPTLIELSLEPAPGFVTPGRLVVREPRAATPAAPISWWIPRGNTELELVLGGGYTGYSFTLRSSADGVWAGRGTYFADFGVEPAPEPLSLKLTPAACS